MKWLKIKMFEPNVFGCLPSSGLKNDDRPYVHIYLVNVKSFTNLGIELKA